MSNSILGTGLKYALYLRDANGEWVQDGECEFNLMPQVAIDHIASLIRGSGATPIANWYMGLFEGNYVPTAGVTAADLPGVVGECQAYDEASRPLWAHTYDGESVIGNETNLTVFTMNATKRINGAFLCSNGAKGGNTGLILSICRFDTPRDVTPGQEFGVGGLLTLIPTSF